MKFKRCLAAVFRDKPIDQILLKDVKSFKTARARQKSPRTKRLLRPATVNRELALLKHLFSHNDDVVPQNPVRKKGMLLDEDNEQKRVLTPDEERLYLMACSQPLQDIAILMLQCGMRPEEVCRIRRENVHIDEGYLFNPHGKTKAARRDVWLDEAATAVVSRRLATIKGDYLFPGRVEGQPIVKVNASHNAAVKRSGVKRFRLYDLRHTFASRMNDSGVDVPTLALLLGHAHWHMVKRYVHPSKERQREAMQKKQRYMATK